MDKAVVESIPAVYPGSLIVHISTGDVYRIKRFNAKTLVVTDALGKEYVLKTGHPGAFKAIREATDQETESFRGEELRNTVFFRPGNIVRWKNPTNPKSKGLFVVTKETANGYNLSPLGGNVTGEFFRSVPGALIEKVDGDITVTNA